MRHPPIFGRAQHTIDNFQMPGGDTCDSSRCTMIKFKIRKKDAKMKLCRRNIHSCRGPQTFIDQKINHCLRVTDYWILYHIASNTITNLHREH